MSNVNKLKPTVPVYAVNLLFAAKGALCAASHDFDQAIERLEDAVLTFEDEMPVEEGVISTDG